MVSDVARYPQSRSRREPRTNLFAMATVYSDSGSTPVKVRNLSSTGARIEGAVLPTAGAQIRLRRGSLEVAGQIAWCREGEAGVRFASKVTVPDWLPRGRAITAQQRIDDVVHQNRVSSAAPPPAQGRVPDVRPNSSDLTRLNQALKALAEELATDPVVFERHGHKLQLLDMVAGALQKLAAT